MSRVRIPRFLLVGVLVTFAVGISSALPLVALSQTTDRATPTSFEVTATFGEGPHAIGDRVDLVVVVTHANDVVVTVPRPTVPAPEFEFVSEAIPEISPTSDGATVTTARFTYQIFALGSMQTGPIIVRWLVDDGTSGVMTNEPVEITITPVRGEADAALRPLKSPLSINGAPPIWLQPLLYASTAIAVIAVLIILARRAAAFWRQRRTPLIESPDLYVPERSARERLDSIHGVNLVDDESFQNFYGTIAEVVRRYLSERFTFNASALTTSELERRMTGHGVDRWQARLVSGLLDRCDRAVYARHYPDPASADHDLTVAYEIVELSRPPTAEVMAS